MGLADIGTGTPSAPSPQIVTIQGNATGVPIPVAVSSVTASLDATATAAAPSYVEGTPNPLSQNLTGDLRTIIKIAAAQTLAAVTAITNALPAGQNVIGNVGGKTVSVTVTPTVTSATYGANVVVGGLLTFANLFTSTGSGIIQSVSLNFNTAQTVGWTLYPFSGNPTASTWTDHSAAAITGADIFLVRPPISLSTANSGLGTMTNYSATGLGQAYVTGGTSGYFILVPTATSASLGGTANVVSVSITVLQDA